MLNGHPSGNLVALFQILVHDLILPHDVFRYSLTRRRSPDRFCDRAFLDSDHTTLNRSINSCTILSITSTLPQLYSKAYRLDASHLGERYSSILYRKPFATGLYQWWKGIVAGLLDYPETVKYEFGKTLDVVPFKILLPVRAQIASLSAPAFLNCVEVIGSFIAKTGIKVGGPLRRVLLEFLDGLLTGATILKVRAFAVVLTDVQPGPPSPLFGDDHLAYRLSRYPKDLTDPCVRALRMGFYEPDHVPGSPFIVPFPPRRPMRPLSSPHQK